MESQIFIFLIVLLFCDGHIFVDPLLNGQNRIRKRNVNRPQLQLTRRMSVPAEPSVILGVPSYPYHLPPAEPILPGHTLLRPAIGMLKSSIKFPHREQEDGAGVYGKYENLGIRFDGRDERVLYTGFRRSLPQLPNNNQRRNIDILVDPKLQNRRHLEYQPWNNELSQQNNHGINQKRQQGNNDGYNIKNILHLYTKAIIAELERPHYLSLSSSEKKTLRMLDKILMSLRRPHDWYHEIYHDTPRFSNNIRKPRDIFAGKAIIIKNVKETDWQDIFRIIKSLRRDVKIKSAVKPKLYVPGTTDFGFFSIPESEPDSAVSNKTSMFWKTKNAFNHIKINADAPDQPELVPPKATEKPRKWWFYHQSDFEYFEDT